MEMQYRYQVLDNEKCKKCLFRQHCEHDIYVFDTVLACWEEEIHEHEEEFS